jgi:endonuclease G
MRIATELIQGSIQRAGQMRTKLAAVERVLAKDDRPRNASPLQKQRRMGILLAQAGGNELVASAAFERLIGGNDLTSINYLQIGTRCSNSVCRLHLRDAGGATVGFATGFLVAPGVLLTNHHVISNASTARFTTAEFDYELDADGNDKSMVQFAVLDAPAPIPFKDLDFCLAAVSPASVDGRYSLDEYGWLPLNASRGKAIVGEYLTIIQHPGGERKQVCVRENKLLKFDDSGNTLWYQTDTVAGSSGSPVFNNSWQVVALHHSGIPKTNDKGQWLTVDGRIWDQSIDESQVDWIANEGIRISRLIEYLQTAQTGSPLTKALLAAISTGASFATSRRPETLPASALNPEVRDGELRLTIPVEVAIRIGGGLGLPGPGSRPAPPAARAPGEDGKARGLDAGIVIPSGIEVVNVDQSNYDARPGYDEKFLGGKVRVPLPIVRKVKSPPRLNYWNYSVVMNKARRLAFFSAVNVDISLRPDAAGRDGDRWYFDPRLTEKGKTFQLGPEFYGAQKEFEVDRANNPFDRGHLTRRLDAQWGKTAKESKRNGDDSFHWTNCTPQHWQLNQGKKRWLGLEDYVIQGFAEGASRACVINGPVFDAPLSTRGPDGRPIPNLKGKAHADPIFGDVAIPKLFFKVVACLKDGGELAAAAFLMSQEDLIAGIDRLKGMPSFPDEILTDAEAKLYQVSLADLGTLTGLEFRSVAASDAAEKAVTAPIHVETFDDIRL